jgi:hypothetical protein
MEEGLKRISALRVSSTALDDAIASPAARLSFFGQDIQDFAGDFHCFYNPD